MRLELHHPIRCSDGAEGELVDVVVDPGARRVTHVVVRTGTDWAPDRLAPIGLLSDDGSGTLRLECSLEEARALPSVGDYTDVATQGAPAGDAEWDVGIQRPLSAPDYPSAAIDAYQPAASPSMGIAYDRVPKGRVEIRHASRVRAADGADLGRVEGFEVDAEDHITHLVLERGHLWTHRDVTVPLEAVAEVRNDEVTLSLTRHEVGELPSVRVHRGR